MLPPLPPGATLIGQAKAEDPYDLLTREGFTFSNGFRTEGDVDRIRAQGYSPATDGPHNRGDGVDLDHPTLSPQQQLDRLDALFGGWDGFRAQDEGHHRHLELPGWGKAPGTPNTPNSGMPPLPEGATLIQRGSIAGDDLDAPQALADPAISPPTSPITADNPAPVEEAPGVLLFRDEQPDAVSKRLKPEDEAALGEMIRTGATVAELRAFTSQRGFAGPDNFDEIVRLRDEGATLTDGVQYRFPEVPKQDDAAGAFLRGAGDPFNLSDELEGAKATIGLTPGRENIWTSDQPWGDILGGNIDAERAGIAADERDHPWARLGGQVTTSVILPFGNKARTAGDLAKWGAAEGGLAGFGAGEGGPIDRLPTAAVGAAGGAAAGYALGKAIEKIGVPAYQAIRARMKGAPEADVERVVIEVAEAAQAPVAGAPARTVDRIDVADLPPLPPGAALIDELPKRGAAPAASDEFPAFEGKPQALVDAAEVERRMKAITPDEAEIQRIRDEAFDAAVAQTSGIPENSYRGAMARQRADQRGGRTLTTEQVEAGVKAADEATANYWQGHLNRIRQEVRAERLAGVPPVPQSIADTARGVSPEDVTPVPGNTVGSLEEFDAATAGAQRKVVAPDEYEELGMRSFPSKRNAAVKMNRRGPVDLVTFLRTRGGIRDDGGELAHMGINNKPRPLDFARDEWRFGKLVDNEKGMHLDDAAFAAQEAGFFPDVADGERITIREFLDALEGTHTGLWRVWRPEDVDELARFDAAQRARGAIETAEQEGAPIYEDIGETISFDDLEELSPPATAYEDFPRVTGRIGNINLARIEKPEDVARLLNHIRSRVGGFDEARRGTITFEETQRLAKEINLKPKDILKRAKGQALNAEELYALRVTVQKSRQLVAKMAQKAVGGSDEDLARFRNAWARHVMIEEQVAGATSEAGRALSQFRMLAKARDARGDAVKAYLEVAGGRDTVEDAARKIADLIEVDPAKASKAMRDTLRIRKRDVFNEVWVNSLLSGPRTHLVNFISNAFAAVYQLPEQAATAGIGAILRTPDRVTMREVGARAVGLMQGASEGWRLAKEAWKTGMPIDGVSRLDAHKYQVVPGKLGHVIRTPTRALAAADEFWKSVNRRGATNAAAYRRAFDGPGTLEEKAARFEELVSNPDKALREYGDSQARYYTFQTPLGKAGRSISVFSNEMPGAKLVLPFVRTPINLLKFAGERSPFAPLLREFKDAMKAGGNARNEAMARMVMGSGLSALAVTLTLNGRISGGGPTDPKERQALRNSGWQPYSIKVGNEWVSYQRFEPFSMLLGGAADFTEVALSGQATNRELDELALGLAMAVAKNVTSKTWLSGPSDAFEVLTDPERYGKNYVERMVGSLSVPAIVAHAAQATDPYLREVSGLLDSIKNRVPGLSDDLQARRNVWGDEIKRGSGAGTGPIGSAYNFASPVYTTKETSSPLLKEAARLRARLSMPQRSLKIDGETVKLTAEQYSYYVQLSGKSAKAELEEFIQTDDWQSMNDDERREYMSETFKYKREEARDTLKEMFPELNPNREPAVPARKLPTPPLPSGAVLIP